MQSRRNHNGWLDYWIVGCEGFLLSINPFIQFLDGQVESFLHF